RTTSRDAGEKPSDLQLDSEFDDLPRRQLEVARGRTRPARQGDEKFLPPPRHRARSGGQEHLAALVEGNAGGIDPGPLAKRGAEIREDIRALGKSVAKQDPVKVVVVIRDLAALRRRH